MNFKLKILTVACRKRHIFVRNGPNVKYELLQMIYCTLQNFLLQDGDTALICAARWGEMDVCKYLCEKKVDISVKNKVSSILGCFISMKLNGPQKWSISSRQMPQGFSIEDIHLLSPSLTGYF